MLYILELSISLHVTNECRLYNSFSIPKFSDYFSISDDKYLNEYQKDLQTKVWNFDPAFSNKRVDMFVTFLLIEFCRHIQLQQEGLCQIFRNFLYPHIDKSLSFDYFEISLIDWNLGISDSIIYILYSY